MAFSFNVPGGAAPAPAAGGFSFGGAPAPAPGGASKPPTPAGGGFNFAAPPAPAAPAPAAGGFNFGGAPAAGGDAAKAPAGGLFGASTAAAPSTTPAPAAGGLFGGASTAAAPAGGDAAKPAAAPAAGGFSFGGAAAAPAGDSAKAPAAAGGGLFGAPSAPAADAKTPAPAAGGFSFGGAAPAAAKEGEKKDAPTATPAAKGFAFGGTTPGPTPAAKAPSPVQTPAGTPAPAAGGLFGSTPGATPAPTGAATPAAATAATDKPPAPIEPPPIEYQSLTIEQILNRFQSELESDAVAFFAEAKRVAHYDTTLRETQASLGELTNGVSRLMLHQSEVDAQLNGIGSYQRELGGTLDLLERNVDELFAAQGNVDVADADVERERGYERAIDVDARLGSMSGALKGIAGELNAAQERAWASGGGEGKDEEVGKIVGVFNAHHETLAYLEGRARAVEADLAVLGQVLARGG
ncbi:hypothetical protein ACHAXT_007292 [Thalassiosira profunda]